MSVESVFLIIGLVALIGLILIFEEVKSIKNQAKEPCKLHIWAISNGKLYCSECFYTPKQEPIPPTGEYD